VRVLVAEDDAKSRKILKKTVEGFGHECLLTKNGLEAWELYQNTPEVDVVISDWVMPGIDGLELCRRIRRVSHAGYTFFILLSPPEDKEDPTAVMRIGADDYLTKPLDSEQLRATFLTASRVTSLRRRLNGGSKVETNGRGKEIALRDEYQLRANESLSTRKLGIGGVKLWDALIARGKVTEEQVQLALEAQKSDPRELRKIIVSLGFVSEAELAQVQAEHLKLDYIELTERDVDAGVVGLVPQRVLRKHRAVPLRIDSNRRLVVAMSDPTDLHALEDLRMTSGYKVAPVVATEEDIRRTQAKVFAIGEEVTKLLEEAAGARVKDNAELDLGVEAHPDEKPVIRLVSSILQQALGDGASDIHIEPRASELTVRLRVDGVLREIMSIPPKLQSGVISRLKILGNLDIAEKRVPQDGRFSVKLAGQKVDLRVASLPTVYGERLVLRLLDTSSVEVTLDKLGFDPKTLARYEEIFRKPSGTTLVTGPTGSGKTTTLYATLRQLNSPEKNIITVEDPVEYRIRGISQVQVNPRAGLTFASGLRSILRNDPDIMMIGEIRDHETAKISVEAALTGHLVLATLHTNSAPSAVNRLTDMGIEPFLTASAVDCVIAQRLARKLCERCKQPAQIEEEILQSMQFPFEHAGSGDLEFYRAVGCSRCGGTGYRGRVGLYELMVVTNEIRELVLRRSSTEEIARAAEREGMIRLRDDGLLKAARGMTTIEEALRVVV
jgi:type IV pilus assembly protein PilB